MSADPLNQPVPRTDHDLLGRLAAVDHRLHQISTQLTTLGTVLRQLDKICANVDTLIGRVGEHPPVGRPPVSCPVPPGEHGRTGAGPLSGVCVVSVDALGNAIHLLSTAEVFEGGFPTTMVAVCGEPVTDGPSVDDDNPRYCRKCVREALRWFAPL
ncbi:MAG: hypothetical protein JO272_14370 [Pseudonocardiales bacterium]|nr:hypothetical protein [Pseudonocardiales bacterium]